MNGSQKKKRYKKECITSDSLVCTATFNTTAHNTWLLLFHYFQVKNLLTGCYSLSYAFSFGIPNYIHKAPLIIEGNLSCLDG